MSDQFKVAVLISGRGSNLKSLIERAQSYKVISVLSDNLEALGLQIAKENGIFAAGFSRSNYSSRKELKRAIFEKVQESGADLVVLAGFMQIVDKEFVDALYGRLINVHPSLLPAYPGLDTHERVIAAREKRHGCTVHFVDSGVDTGPIIAQAQVPVVPLDCEHTLASRVLSFEHLIYPWAVDSIARGDITLDGRKVHYSATAVKQAADNGFLLPSLTKASIQ